MARRVATTEIFAGLQKLDRAQEEASLDLGASQWQTFWRVTVPNLRLSIIGAGLLIFTLSMDEIAVSFFLIGRDNTLPLEISYLIIVTRGHRDDMRVLRWAVSTNARYIARIGSKRKVVNVIKGTGKGRHRPGELRARVRAHGAGDGRGSYFPGAPSAMDVTAPHKPEAERKRLIRL